MSFQEGIEMAKGWLSHSWPNHGGGRLYQPADPPDGRMFPRLGESQKELARRKAAGLAK